MCERDRERKVRVGERASGKVREEESAVREREREENMERGIVRMKERLRERE